jgi:hypothetical protein
MLAKGYFIQKDMYPIPIGPKCRQCWILFMQQLSCRVRLSDNIIYIGSMT